MLCSYDVWSWFRKKREHDAFEAGLRRVEDDCRRRLDFTRRQVERLERRGPWQIQVTVADADIMPLPSHQAMYHNVLTRLLVWQWVVISITAFMLGVAIGLIL